jgi:hypothetical protein
VHDGASASEGGAQGEAGLSGAGFCATRSPTTTVFCADFDESTDAGGTFTKLILGTGALVETSPLMPFSAPRSLHSVQTMSAEPAGAAVTIPITAGSHVLTIDLEARLTTIPGNGMPKIGPLAMIPTKGPDLYYYTDTSAAYVQIGSGAIDGKTTTPPQAAHWFHINIKIQMDGTTSTITAGSGGTQFVSNATMPTAWPTPNNVEIQVGLPQLYMLSAGDAYVDNLVVDLK